MIYGWKNEHIRNKKVSIGPPYDLAHYLDLAHSLDLAQNLKNEPNHWEDPLKCSKKVYSKYQNVHIFPP